LRIRRGFAGKALARLRFQIEERLHRVDGRAAIRRFAENVVEDFERQRSRVAGDQNIFEEACEIELALAGKAPVMAAPLQHVHREPRRVRHLEKKYLVAGNLRNRGGIVAERQNMEAVDDHAQVRMVGLRDDRPRVLVVADVPSPGQRFIADP
jgi:hypothetical protein